MKAILLLALLGVALSQKSFSADVKIIDPTVPGGLLTGKMFYNPSIGAGHQRIDFSLGVQEFFEFSNNPNVPSLRYLVCPGQCQTETFKISFFKYFQVAGDSAAGTVTVNGKTCSNFNRGGVKVGEVNSFAVDANGLPCRATFLGTGGNNKLIEFSNVDGTYNANPSLSPPPALNKAICPQPSCNKKMDIDLVFDESGSIDRPSFAAEVQFARDIANSFTFGVNAVQMALEQFSTTSRHTINLTPIKQNFLNAMNGVTQTGGTTCIVCGCEAARAELFSGRARAGVTKFMVILTDGQANVRVNEIDGCFNRLKADGVTIAAIGVGPEFNPAQVRGLASNDALFFSSPSFQALNTILNSLIQATCDDLPASLCPSSCKGFCSCGGTCICPDQCLNGNACQDSKCVLNQNGNGCVNSTKNCDDNNKCTTDSCNPVTGCVHTAVNCDDGNFCTTDACNPQTGCTHTTINCASTDPCFKSTAVSTNPQCCVDTPITCCPAACPKIPCKINTCDPAGTAVCTATDKICNSGNPCNIDSCDPLTDSCVSVPKNCDDSDKCTIDSCNAQGQCVHTPIDPQTCNDNSVCTIDTCDPQVGCVNKPIACNGTNPCLTNNCDSILGCQANPIDCSQQIDKFKQGDCQLAICDPVKGCILEPIPGASIDACGFCVQAGQSAPFCFLGLGVGAVAGLSAGIVAAIVIAVIAAVVIAAVSSAAGYAIYKRGLAGMGGAQANPMFKGPGNSGNNPMFKS